MNNNGMKINDAKTNAMKTDEARLGAMKTDETLEAATSAGTSYEEIIIEEMKASVNEASDICGCCRKKKRTQQEYRNLINRLSRIEGQIRGIKNMLDNDAYCIDILIQVSAASSALSSFSKVLLTEHIKTCVADDLRNGRDETVDELTDVLRRLMK